MGYLLRTLRLASYLVVVLGLLLIFGAKLNNSLFFYGIRFLFIGLVGIGSMSMLKDRYIEGTEEEEDYLSLLPTPKIKTPYIPPVTIAAISSTKKEVLLGAITGFIGVLVSSFGTVEAYGKQPSWQVAILISFSLAVSPTALGATPSFLAI